MFKPFVKPCCVVIALFAMGSTYGAAQDADAGTAPSIDAPATQDAPLQTAPASEEQPPQRGSRLLDEVVVTAQKREENSKDVPVSVTAFSSEKLDAKAVVDVGDLPKITPGLHVNETAGFAVMYLRGVGSDAFILGDPLVVTYIDDVYFPFSAGQMVDFGAVESVEVLKGPQGTLFGRNALGGAIKTKTLDPSFETYQASLKYSYGSYNAHNFSGRISIPIYDKLAISVSGLKHASDNYRKLLHTEDFVPVPREKEYAYRGKMFFEPFDWLELRANYAVTNQDGASSMQTNAHPSLVGSVLGIQPQNARDGGKNDFTIVKFTETRTLFGGATIFTPWADIKLLGSRQKVEDINTVDFDGSDRRVASFVGMPGFADTTTAELQILSNQDSPGADWVRWIAGAYYFNSRAGFKPARLFVDALTLSSYGIDVSALVNPLVSLLNGLGISLPILGSNPLALLSEDTALQFYGILKTESLAFYSQVDFDLVEWATLTIGARYQIEDRMIEESSAAVKLPGADPIVYQRFSHYTDPDLAESTKNFDPKVTLSIRPGWEWLGEDALLYATYQTATTSLTFNSINILDQPERVESTEITAYEVGVKTRLFDGMVDFNAALFHYDIDNPQVQTVSLLAGGAVAFENAESQRIRGAEFEALVLLLPELTDNGLVLTASGAYLDAIYTSYKNGSGFNPQTGLYETGQDYTGNQVVRAPKYSLSAGLNYTLFTDWGPLEFGVDYYYNSGYPYLAQGTELASEEAFSTLGANMNFLIERWDLRIALFGKNLWNEGYNLSRFTTDFGTDDLPAPRASYGIQITWNFEYDR